MLEIKNGIYKHYKGGEYKILGEGFDSQDEGAVVIYKSLKDNKIWVRPKSEFLEEVEVKGEKKTRFEFLHEDEDEIWEHRYKRALADYQNLLKQTVKDKEEFVKYALNDFLQNVLPVYDHLKMALGGLKEEEEKNPWVEGVKHVLKQFKSVLEQHGIEEIGTVGAKFDHETMEAIDGAGETVAVEVMPGYKLHGKVIRHAKVIVK